MRKFAIVSLLVAGVAFGGSALAQDAAPQAAPATKAASSSHHHKKKSSQSTGGQKKGRSAKHSGKATLPPVTTSH